MNSFQMKNTILIRTFVVVIALAASIHKMNAQFDPMFTQYMFNEMYINPAYAGSRDNISATGLIREQWAGLAGAPATQTFSVHAPVANKKVGLGISFLNESIGVGKRTGINLNGAYRIPMDKMTLSFGLQMGLVNLMENYQALVTQTSNDNQFSGNSKRYLAPNFGFGTYLQSDKWYVGLSIPRMMENRINYGGGSTEVSNKFTMSNWHYFLTAGTVHTLSPSIKLRPSVMLKAVSGAPINLDLSANLLFQDIIWAGAAYRNGDAFSVLLGAYITKQLRLGYAYDFTTSALKNFSAGSHELSLGFDMNFDKNKVLTPRYF
jgi:type IX secretion system PorP/SprF family membrane protein